ncbi:MAG: ProQ/FINO family protein [Halothiobacillaceae bacterium]
MDNLHSAAKADTPLDSVSEMLDAEVLASEEASVVELAVDADTASDEETSSEAPKVKSLHPRAVLNILADRYPAAFHADGRLVRPLAIGVLQELRAAREGENPLPVSMQDLRRALRYYTQGAAYHRAVARGDARISLMGEVVAEVTEEQKAHSAAKLLELEPKLPKRPERAPRPAMVGDSAEAGAEGAASEHAGREGAEERPRRPRNPLDKRPAGRTPRREGARNDKRNRPPREDKPAAMAQDAAASKDEAPAVALDMNDKLSLLVAKFGR